ncbi:MAG: hypothetical protein BA864_06950 [Desulfuromonadales bacterium C00003093]|nr:MAG: hypothetical protein BA864_06950 [Desulfuromonadales bacterium C00003093]
MTVETAPRIASCKRRFERTVLTPVDWATEHEVLVVPLPGEGSPLFPACVDCDCADGDDNGIEIMPDDNDVFHRVKTCNIRFRAVDDTGDTEPQQGAGV